MDECHEALSTRVKKDKENATSDFLPITKQYFDFGKETLTNILVSATPMLGDDPIKQLQLIANFLNRNSDFNNLIGKEYGDTIDLVDRSNKKDLKTSMYINSDGLEENRYYEKDGKWYDRDPDEKDGKKPTCLLYTSPSPRD